jgi:hypothetical protein
MKIVDLTGNELKKGDVISYPRRTGSHIWMSFGLIDEIHDEDSATIITPNGKKTTISAALRRCILIHRRLCPIDANEELEKLFRMQLRVDE